MPPATPPPTSLPLRRVSEVQPREIAWLWPGRLPLGKPALLEGDPDLGKSLITLDLCARLSSGAAFADGSPSPGPATAIILNGEDNAEDTIRPRLQAMGADLDRVYIPEAGEHAGSLLWLPTHTDKLEKSLAETQARLVVIDPLVAFLDAHVNLSNDASVRRALSKLAGLAEQHACAMLLVRHLNKRAGLRSLYRGSGSIGLVGLSRSGWLVARDPEDSQRRVLAQVKNNLGAPQPSLVHACAGGARRTGAGLLARSQCLERRSTARQPARLAPAGGLCRGLPQAGPERADAQFARNLATGAETGLYPVHPGSRQAQSAHPLGARLGRGPPPQLLALARPGPAGECPAKGERAQQRGPLAGTPAYAISIGDAD
jgi:hypothetical protein